MADRRLPYARTLAVLRVLCWPYRYPPLSWYVKFIDYIAARPVLWLDTTITMIAVIILMAVSNA